MTTQAARVLLTRTALLEPSALSTGRAFSTLNFRNTTETSQRAGYDKQQTDAAVLNNIARPDIATTMPAPPEYRAKQMQGNQQFGQPIQGTTTGMPPVRDPIEGSTTGMPPVRDPIEGSTTGMPPRNPIQGTTTGMPPAGTPLQGKTTSPPNYAHGQGVLSANQDISYNQDIPSNDISSTNAQGDVGDKVDFAYQTAKDGHAQSNDPSKVHHERKSGGQYAISDNQKGPFEGSVKVEETPSVLGMAKEAVANAGGYVADMASMAKDAVKKAGTEAKGVFENVKDAAKDSTK